MRLPIDAAFSEGRDVWAHIAVTAGQLNAAEFRQFLGIALGSTFEIKTQLIVAGKLGMGSVAAIDEATALGEEVSKMLTSFIQKLGSKARRQS